MGSVARVEDEYDMPARRDTALVRAQLGFRDGPRGTHLSRTLMLSEIATLLESTPAHAGVADYRHAVVDDNVLGKRTHTTREHTVRKLKALYGLDPSIPIFRALRTFWPLDVDGRPLLAMLCGFARDPLLRITGVAFVLLSILRHGATEKSQGELRRELLRELELQGLSSPGLSTLRRWRDWWCRLLPETPFWRATRGRLVHPVAGDDLPAGLLLLFAGDPGTQMEALLSLLAPLSTSSCPSWSGSAMAS